MVTLTNQPTDVLIRPGDANVPRTELVTLLDEMVAGINAAPLRPVASSATNVTVTADDVGAFYLQTAASTLNLPAAATAGNGFTIFVQADGGAVTVDPNGAETINGAATLAVADGAAALVTCTGAAWRAILIEGVSGLGTAASEDVGTAIGDVVQLVDQGGAPALPAVSGALLTGLDRWVELAATGTTTGTAVDFTSLPAGIKEIEIWFDRVTFDSTDDLLVQIGTGGSPTTTGYDAAFTVVSSNVSSAAGFPMFQNLAANSIKGMMRLYRLTGNIWVSQSVASYSINAGNGAGRVELAGALDNIRITSLAGTQNFDGGLVQVRYRT